MRFPSCPKDSCGESNVTNLNHLVTKAGLEDEAKVLSFGEDLSEAYEMQEESQINDINISILVC